VAAALRNGRSSRLISPGGSWLNPVRGAFDRMNVEHAGASRRLHRLEQALWRAPRLGNVTRLASYRHSAISGAGVRARPKKEG